MKDKMTYVNIELEIPITKEALNDLIYYGYDFDRSVDYILQKEYPEIYERLTKEFDEVYRIIQITEMLQDVGEE